MAVKKFLNLCKRHLVWTTIIGVLLVVIFAVVNIEILHMTSEPEFCAMCHPKHGYGPLAEVDSWEHSGHAEAGVSCLDCHGRPGVLGYMKAKMGGLKDTYMQFTISKEEKLDILENPPEDLVPEETCLFCHSDEVNRKVRNSRLIKLVEMRLSDTVVNPTFRERKGLPDIATDDFVGGTHFDHNLHIEGFGLGCRDCHFGVVHRELDKTDRMNLCLVCHLENSDSSAPQLEDCTVCHEAQLAMNKGTGAKGIDGEPSLMYGVGIDCTMCHTGVETGAFRPTSETCVECHDPEYVDIFNDWAESTEAELKQIDALRREAENALVRADKAHRDTKAGWELYKKALYNLQFVEDDGTQGVHNRYYAEAILQEVEADFRKVIDDLKRTW